MRADNVISQFHILGGELSNQSHQGHHARISVGEWKILHIQLYEYKYSPSMRLDYDFHRRMEIYYLYTRPIEIAREAGCRIQKLEMLEAELRFLEAESK